MNAYENKAKNFLIKSGTTMKIYNTGEVYGFPCDRPEDRKMKHNKYRVVLTRDGKSFDFDFYGSYQMYIDGKKPTAYDILATVEKYEAPTDPWEFAEEFGYEIENKADFDRVSKIAYACREEYEGLLGLFGEEYMEELREIN